MCVGECVYSFGVDGWMDGWAQAEGSSRLQRFDVGQKRDPGRGGPGGAGNGRPGDSLWRLLRRYSSSTLGRYELVLSWLPFRAGRTPCF